ncbi:hypothetical protein C0584_02560 [Candidatus Parcubacteria bacterium]|nr:MAG: hypothetical protein C0584_02560 [Candidatus Parcubacteria bacterium]
MNFNFFKKQNNQNRFVDRDNDADKNKEPAISRRTFLKGGLVAATSFALSPALIDLLKLEDEEETEEKLATNVVEDLEDDFYYEQVEAWQEAQSMSTNELLDLSKEGDVELTLEAMEGVKQYWKNVHSTEGNKLHKSFVDGYREIGAYKKELEKIFEEEGVPNKYIHLSIPESYWVLDAKSPVGALGPYQFMKSTASKYELYSKSGQYDYRTDPFKSARACARLLKDLHDASGDWDLALSGYNGGYFWRYLKEAVSSDEKPDYEGFLKYLEKKINVVRNETKYGDVYEHRLRSTLGYIARRVGVSVDKIAQENGIKDPNKVRKGIIIRIPLENDSVRERVYKMRIAGYRENLNYPAKFNAIDEAIEEGVVTEQKEPADFSLHVTKNVYPKSRERKAEKEKYFVYRVKKSEGWYRVHQNVKHLTKATQEDIKKLNKKIAQRGLRENDEILIPKKA